MATEKRLIDANKLSKEIDFEYDLGYGEILTDPKRFADMVEDAPTVDAVEVVHCCDCQKRTALNQDGYREPLLFCKHWEKHPMVDPTDFCSYGERRTT